MASSRFLSDIILQNAEGQFLLDADFFTMHLVDSSASQLEFGEVGFCKTEHVLVDIGSHDEVSALTGTSTVAVVQQRSSSSSCQYRHVGVLYW